jgi:hypothetical protein
VEKKKRKEPVMTTASEPYLALPILINQKRRSKEISGGEKYLKLRQDCAL